jgi:hypothetical protein
VAQIAKGFVHPTKHVKKEQPHCEGNIRVKEDDKIASLVALVRILIIEGMSELVIDMKNFDIL